MTRGVAYTPSQYHRSTVEKSARWNPWQTLRASEEIGFALLPLPDVTGGGVYRPQPDGTAAIVVDRRLPRRLRRCLLAHELIHHERGGGIDTRNLPHTLRVMVGREEARVEDEVARRLVPLEELVQVVKQWADIDEHPEVWQLAEHFDVTEWTMRRALKLAAGDG